jgi:hypothetical protein
MPEFPVAYRVWWFVPSNHPFDKQYKGEKSRRDFATREDAEAFKTNIAAFIGGNTVACVQPVYISSSQREKKLQAAQDTLAMAGWPVQHKPVRVP